MWEQLPQFVMSGLTTGAIYALVALGFCIIHNTTGIVNFAQGDFLSLGGLMMYTFLFGAGMPVPLAFILSCASVAVVGFIMERLAIRPARNRHVVVLIFITIGASILMRGIFKHIWGKEPLALPPSDPGRALAVFGRRIHPPEPVGFGHHRGGHSSY